MQLRKKKKKKSSLFGICAHAHTHNVLSPLQRRKNTTMLRRSFSRAAVALNGTTINPNVKAAKVRAAAAAAAAALMWVTKYALKSSHARRFRGSQANDKRARCTCLLGRYIPAGHLQYGCIYIRLLPAVLSRRNSASKSKTLSSAPRVSCAVLLMYCCCSMLSEEPCSSGQWSSNARWQQGRSSPSTR